MESIRRVRKTELARNTRQVIKAVLRGETAVIEDHGEPEAAIIDIVDYYILRAVMRYHAHPSTIERDAGLSDAEAGSAMGLQERYNVVMAYYLADAITLARAAELLELSSLDLRLRFVHLEVPLRIGPQTIEDARAEVETLRSLREEQAE